MNEFTIKISNSSRTQVIRVTHAHWMGAVDKASEIHRWGMKFDVLSQNGRDFKHGNTIYI